MFVQQYQQHPSIGFLLLIFLSWSCSKDLDPPKLDNIDIRVTEVRDHYNSTKLPLNFFTNGSKNGDLSGSDFIADWESSIITERNNVTYIETPLINHLYNIATDEDRKSYIVSSRLITRYNTGTKKYWQFIHTKIFINKGEYRENHSFVFTKIDSYNLYYDLKGNLIARFEHRDKRLKVISVNNKLPNEDMELKKMSINNFPVNFYIQKQSETKVISFTYECPRSDCWGDTYNYVCYTCRRLVCDDNNKAFSFFYNLTEVYNRMVLILMETPFEYDSIAKVVKEAVITLATDRAVVSAITSLYSLSIRFRNLKYGSRDTFGYNEYSHFLNLSQFTDLHEMDVMMLSRALLSTTGDNGGGGGGGGGSNNNPEHECAHKKCKTCHKCLDTSSSSCDKCYKDGMHTLQDSIMKKCEIINKIFKIENNFLSVSPFSKWHNVELASQTIICSRFGFKLYNAVISTPNVYTLWGASNGCMSGNNIGLPFDLLENRNTDKLAGTFLHELFHTRQKIVESSMANSEVEAKLAKVIFAQQMRIPQQDVEQNKNFYEALVNLSSCINSSGYINPQYESAYYELYQRLINAIVQSSGYQSDPLINLNSSIETLRLYL